MQKLYVQNVWYSSMPNDTNNMYKCLFVVRDDEHCTALMLAAETGQALVMKILLDNHASVNDVDKMKVFSSLKALSHMKSLRKILTSFGLLHMPHATLFSTITCMFVDRFLK